MKIAKAVYRGPAEDVTVANGSTGTIEVPLAESRLRHIDSIIAVDKELAVISGLEVQSVEYHPDKIVYTVYNGTGSDVTVSANSIEVKALVYGY